MIDFLCPECKGKCRAKGFHKYAVCPECKRIWRVVLIQSQSFDRMIIKIQQAW